MSDPLPDDTRSTLEAAWADEPSAVGAAFGPYRVVRLLGRGGMGAVYLAAQEEPIRRVVALKVVRLGLETKPMLARFEAERQSLARMGHPGIAPHGHHRFSYRRRLNKGRTKKGSLP